MQMILNMLKRNLKLLGGFIGNGEPPPPPPCVRACFAHRFYNFVAAAAMCSGEQSLHEIEKTIFTCRVFFLMCTFNLQAQLEPGTRKFEKK